MANALAAEQARRFDVERELAQARTAVDEERHRREAAEATAARTAQLLAEALAETLTAKQEAQRAREDLEQAVRPFYPQPLPLSRHSRRGRRWRRLKRRLTARR